MSAPVQALKVGITGAIGTGKSEVTRILRARGYPVIDADQVARRLTETSAEIREALRRRFGAGIFDEQGNLRRRELAQVVFRDPAALRDLNAIVHPGMIEEIRREMGRLASEGRSPVFVEAAVIYEAGMEGLFDVVAVVAADLSEAVRRVTRRNGLSEQEVWDRYRSQIPLEEKIRRADYVIWNNGTLWDLEREVERFLVWLKERGDGREK
ncbi:MAG TPA: dephospho-CoA kinase [Bacteroidetes bacterium]|nr:dephospho-CoA kinase [Bacteroidota bacterium]